MCHRALGDITLPPICPREWCVWGIELTRPAMAGIQAGVERYPALIRWTLYEYTVHWAKLYAMHGTVPYGLTPIGRSYK